MNILQDDRIQWIRQKTVLALDITIECFNEYFIESLERARSAGITLLILLKVLVQLRRWLKLALPSAQRIDLLLLYYAVLNKLIISTRLNFFSLI